MKKLKYLILLIVPLSIALLINNTAYGAASGNGLIYRYLIDENDDLLLEVDKAYQDVTVTINGVHYFKPKTRFENMIQYWVEVFNNASDRYYIINGNYNILVKDEYHNIVNIMYDPIVIYLYYDSGGGLIVSPFLSNDWYGSYSITHYSGTNPTVNRWYYFDTEKGTSNYAEGYDKGFDDGRELGDIEGYNRGINEVSGEQFGFHTLLSFVLVPFQLLNTDLFMGIKIGHVVLIPIIFGLIGWLFSLRGKK